MQSIFIMRNAARAVFPTRPIFRRILQFLVPAQIEIAQLKK